MAAEFGVPVHVGNDANATALAVRTFHDAAPSFMLVTIEQGVGAGLVVGDTLVEGSRSNAGEIGGATPIEGRGGVGCLQLAMRAPHSRLWPACTCWAEASCPG
jgi:predicted NBD/HSP70 family sugar kinase